MVLTIELLKKGKTFELLKFFLEHPTQKFHAQQLVKSVNIYRNGILGGLHELTNAGILRSEEIGRVIQYSLIRENPIVKQLKILLALDKLMPALEKLKGSGVEAYLYGSCARGEDTEESDIDLLLIGNLGRAEVLGKLGRIEKLKPIYFTFLEYSSLARKDKAFYERVEKDRIRLM
ncbi:MAG: nucleotidyltransferase domain-containing protein [Candidatus Micrarchaeota archaeon]|nr:nucleotidyltransferase domain-containing protein [Candidatus Micrarchaeota archaeon]